MCKGCGAAVAKPITCATCNVASHPACIGRTGHPHLNGQFVDCVSMGSPAIMNMIKDMLHKEFLVFRAEIREMYLADMEKLKADFQGLSNRLSQMEDSFARAQSSISPELLEVDIIEELKDRKRRSTNIILFNVEETDGTRLIWTPSRWFSKIFSQKRSLIRNLQGWEREALDV